MRTAGVVFDFYDDPTGEVLRGVYPTADDLPEIIKEAHILGADDHEVLRNEAYALVMVNEGRMLRKFACVDPGNTLLSMIYLEDAADRMAPEAIKTAAANIHAFCDEYGLQVSPFIKMAMTGMARVRDPDKQPLVGDDADWAQRTNLVSARGGADSGRVIPTANQLKTASDNSDDNMVEGARGGAALGAVTGAGLGYIRGHARVHNAFGGTTTAEDVAKNSPHKKVIVNQGEKLTRGSGVSRRTINGRHVSSRVMSDIGHDLGKRRALKGALLLGAGGALLGGAMGRSGHEKRSGVGGQILTDDVKVNGPSKKNPAELNTKSQAPSFSGPTVEPGPHPKVTNIVDVSGKEPMHSIEKKSYAYTALDGRYGLDSYGDVVSAVQYFEDNWTEMDPIDRHEYAVKTASRASELGVGLPELMERYGSTSYSPDVEAHLASRAASCDDLWKPVYQQFKEKRSSIHPEHFASLLAEADRESGLDAYWGGAICDPWLSTFGGQTKEASALWSWTSSTGETVSAEQLHKLVQNRKILLSKFSQDIVDGLQKSPEQIFDSLPDEHKMIITRMANDDLTKSAGVGYGVREIGGLGILAVPSIQHLRGKKMDEKTTAKYELGGLGALAANEAHDVWGHAGGGSGIMASAKKALGGAGKAIKKIH